MAPISHMLREGGITSRLWFSLKLGGGGGGGRGGGGGGKEERKENKKDGSEYCRIIIMYSVLSSDITPSLTSCAGMRASGRPRAAVRKIL